MCPINKTQKHSSLRDMGTERAQGDQGVRRPGEPMVLEVKGAGESGGVKSQEEPGGITWTYGGWRGPGNLGETGRAE